MEEPVPKLPYDAVDRLLVMQGMGFSEEAVNDGSTPSPPAPRNIEIQSTAEMHKPRRCAFDPPTRFWYQTEHGWASREWKDGERSEYASRVLGR